MNPLPQSIPTGPDRESRLNQSQEFNRQHYGSLRNSHSRRFESARKANDTLAVPEGDPKKATVHIQAKIPPAMFDAIDKVIQNRRFPYRTLSALVRASIHFHLAALGDLAEGEQVQTSSSYLDNMHFVSRETQTAVDNEKHLQTIAEQIEELIENGNIAAARIQLAVQKAQLESSGINHYRWAPRFKKWFREMEVRVARGPQGQVREGR